MDFYNYGDLEREHDFDRPKVIVSNPQAIACNVPVVIISLLDDELEIVEPLAATHIAGPIAQSAGDLEL